MSKQVIDIMSNEQRRRGTMLHNDQIHLHIFKRLQEFAKSLDIILHFKCPTFYTKIQATYF